MQSPQQKVFYYKHGWRTLFTVDTLFVCLMMPIAFYGFALLLLDKYAFHTMLVYAVIAFILAIKRVFNDPVPFVYKTSQHLIINYAMFGFIYKTDKIVLDQINNVEVWETTYRGAKSVYLKITAAKKVFKVHEELLQSASDINKIEQTIREVM